jgi:hypothetical protein
VRQWFGKRKLECDSAAAHVRPCSGPVQGEELDHVAAAQKSLANLGRRHSGPFGCSIFRWRCPVRRVTFHPKQQSRS